MADNKNELKRDLSPMQILMITVSVTIGVGFFVSTGEILAIAGPMGTFLAFFLVGLIAWSMMEGLAHMTIMWPVPNPMVEFPATFVDKDLGTVVCFAYWYSTAISIAAVTTTAGDIFQYWKGGEKGDASKVLIFLLFPVLVFLLNYNNVKLFGGIETVGGMIKSFIVVLVYWTMFFIDWGVGPGNGNHSECVKDGFQNDHRAVAGNSGTVLALSLAVFPYTGIESFTLTAFEAKDQNSLRRPAKLIAPIVMLLYLLSVLGFVLNVDWRNGSLPAYYSQWTNTDASEAYDCQHDRRDLIGDTTTGAEKGDTIIPVIALDQAGLPGYAGFINACLFYSALSMANSLLFVASRTLYGYGRSFNSHSFNQPNLNSPSLNGPDQPNAPQAKHTPYTRSWPARIASKFGHVNSFKVPTAALFASLFFAWTPFLSLGDVPHLRSTQQVLINIGSTSCVIVWAAQSLAYLRMYYSFKKHPALFGIADMKEYDVLNKTKNSSYLGCLQPGLAWFSLFSCLVIVLLFASAGLWNSQGNIALKAVNIYLGPLLCAALYGGLKLKHGYMAHGITGCFRGWGHGWARCTSEHDVKTIIRKLEDKSFLTVDRELESQIRPANAIENAQADTDTQASGNARENEVH